MMNLYEMYTKAKTTIKSLFSRIIKPKKQKPQYTRLINLLNQPSITTLDLKQIKLELKQLSDSKEKLINKQDRKLRKLLKKRKGRKAIRDDEFYSCDKEETKNDDDFLYYENDLDIIYCPPEYEHLTITPELCERLKKENPYGDIPRYIKKSEVPAHLVERYYSAENVRKIHAYKDKLWEEKRRQKEEAEKVESFYKMHQRKILEEEIRKIKFLERNNPKVRKWNDELENECNDDYKMENEPKRRKNTNWYPSLLGPKPTEQERKVKFALENNVEKNIEQPVVDENTLIKANQVDETQDLDKTIFPKVKKEEENFVNQNKEENKLDLNQNKREDESEKSFFCDEQNLNISQGFVKDFEKKEGLHQENENQDITENKKRLHLNDENIIEERKKQKIMENIENEKNENKQNNWDIIAKPQITNEENIKQYDNSDSNNGNALFKNDKIKKHEKIKLNNLEPYDEDIKMKSEIEKNIEQMSKNNKEENTNDLISLQKNDEATPLKTKFDFLINKNEGSSGLPINENDAINSVFKNKEILQSSPGNDIDFKGTNNKDTIGGHKTIKDDENIDSNFNFNKNFMMNDTANSKEIKQNENKFNIFGTLNAPNIDSTSVSFFNDTNVKDNINTGLNLQLNTDDQNKNLFQLNNSEGNNPLKDTINQGTTFNFLGDDTVKENKKEITNNDKNTVIGAFPNILNQAPAENTGLFGSEITQAPLEKIGLFGSKITQTSLENTGLFNLKTNQTLSPNQNQFSTILGDSNNQFPNFLSTNKQANNQQLTNTGNLFSTVNNGVTGNTNNIFGQSSNPDGNFTSSLFSNSTNTNGLLSNVNNMNKQSANSLFPNSTNTNGLLTNVNNMNKQSTNSLFSDVNNNFATSTNLNNMFGLTNNTTNDLKINLFPQSNNTDNTSNILAGGFDSRLNQPSNGNFLSSANIQSESMQMQNFPSSMTGNSNFQAGQNNNTGFLSNYLSGNNNTSGWMNMGQFTSAGVKQEQEKKEDTSATRKRAYARRKF